ncbi:unnamed protein product [Scytosiphon promiscuus]
MRTNSLRCGTAREENKAEGQSDGRTGTRFNNKPAPTHLFLYDTMNSLQDRPIFTSWDESCASRSLSLFPPPRVSHWKGSRAAETEAAHRGSPARSQMK